MKLLLVAAFFNGLSWIILIPVWQYPDEQAHFAQIQDIAELGKVPTNSFDTSYEIALSEKILGTERDQFGNNKFTYHPEYRLDYSDNYFGPQENLITSLPKSARTQLVKNEATFNPPLYYFLGSFFYKLFENNSLFSRIYVVRLMSLIFFLTTIIISFKIGQLIFLKSKTFPLVLASLVAFMPMLVFASTGVLPDSLTNLLFTIVLFLCLKILNQRLETSSIIMITLTIILGVLTRQQFLITVPMVFLAIFFQIRKDFKNIIKVILGLITILFAFFLINSKGTEIPIISEFRLHEPSNNNFMMIFDPKFLDFQIWTLKHMVNEVLPWYWGVYKWLSLTVPHINYQIINRIIFIALFGILIRIIKMIIARELTRSDVIFLFMILASVIYFFIFAIWDYFFFLSHGFSFGIQGRYFFPLIVFYLSILLIGFWQILEIIFKRYAKYVILIISFLMILFNDSSLSYVATSYYDFSNIDVFIKQVSQYKPFLLKGNIILLVLFISFVLQSFFIFSLGKYIIRSNEST